MNRADMIRLHERHNEEELNQGKLSVIDEIYVPGYVAHYAGMPDVNNLEQQRQFVISIRDAFPDIHFTVDNRFVEGDKVYVRWTARGTHLGEYNGIPPTGNQIEVSGMVIHRLVDGQFQESWECVDALGLGQQLGVIPPLGG